MPEWKAKFLELYEKIKELVSCNNLEQPS